MLTHPLTIGKAVANYTPKKKKDSAKSVHLVGTDTPEVSPVFIVQLVGTDTPEVSAVIFSPPRGD